MRACSLTFLYSPHHCAQHTAWSSWQQWVPEACNLVPRKNVGTRLCILLPTLTDFLAVVAVPPVPTAWSMLWPGPVPPAVPVIMATVTMATVTMVTVPTRAGGRVARAARVRAVRKVKTSPGPPGSSGWTEGAVPQWCLCRVAKFGTLATKTSSSRWTRWETTNGGGGDVGKEDGGGEGARELFADFRIYSINRRPRKSAAPISDTALIRIMYSKGEFSGTLAQ